MRLLIDNSNTRTKFALTEPGEEEDRPLSSWRATVPTPKLTSASLQQALAGQFISSVVLCSVVPRAARLIQSHFQDLPFHQISWQSSLPLSIDYPQPSQIGADRLANAAGALTHYGVPAIVIDFGTAVTFDVISAGGAYLGGAIAPGTAALRDYLHRRTALLPAIELVEPRSPIGRSTSEAMQVGAVIGYRGLIREILTETTRVLSPAADSPAPVIIATGGDAALLAEKVDRIEKIDPDLTLEGIRLIGALNLPD